MNGEYLDIEDFAYLDSNISDLEADVEKLREDLVRIDQRLSKLEETVKDLIRAIQHLQVGKALSEVLKARSEKSRREKK